MVFTTFKRHKIKPRQVYELSTLQLLFIALQDELDFLPFFLVDKILDR